MPQAGFLGTTAPWTADVTLLLELALDVGLLAGALLVRAGCHRVHAACQSIIVLLNLMVIVCTMGIAELGSLYILLAAGTTVLPERFRIRRYKFWMRGVLVLWWIVLLLGVTTYARWYVPRR